MKVHVSLISHKFFFNVTVVLLGEGEEPAGILHLLYKRLSLFVSWCQKSISETNVSSSSAGTMFGWPTNTSRVIGTGRWGGSRQSPNYFHRPVLKGEFIKMDKNTRKLVKCTTIRQATGSTRYAYRLTPNSSIPEAGWNSGEYAGSLFLAEAASIYSDLATQIWWKKTQGDSHSFQKWRKSGVKRPEQKAENKQKCFHAGSILLNFWSSLMYHPAFLLKGTGV